MNHHGKSVLLVEDSAADQMLFERAAKEWSASIRLDIAGDGAAGLRAILGEADAEIPPDPPSLLVLDLNLPDMSGHEVLRTLRAASLTTPVVVMSSSYQDLDIELCYREGCNAYVRKLMEPEEYKEAVLAVLDYWLRKVELPQPTVPQRG